MCIPDVVKNMNNKVLNLAPRTNETRYIKFHETCKCKYRIDASVCNNKARWNEDKWSCECKKLIDRGILLMDLFGILIVIVNVNVIYHVMLENILTTKIANVENIN